MLYPLLVNERNEFRSKSYGIIIIYELILKYTVDLSNFLSYIYDNELIKTNGYQ
jgi:hypothetical protein